MDRLGRCIFAVSYIFSLGNSLILVISYPLRWIFGLKFIDEYYATFKYIAHSPSLIVIICVGLISIAVAIYDGEFIYHGQYVKKEHWVNRNKSTINE
jgi:hypothetical protein